MLKKSYYFAILLVLVSNVAFAAKNYNRYIGNYSRELLDVLQWEKKYEADRKMDINYLFGNIDGDIVNNLSEIQKQQLTQLLRKSVFNQMIEDRDEFKDYLIKQYNKFFTIDEIERLISYYKTAVLQVGINAKINRTPFTINEINQKILQAKETDREIIGWFRDSYLNNRYTRFIEKVTPKLNNMIIERLKIIIDINIKNIPNLVEYIKSNPQPLIIEQ